MIKQNFSANSVLNALFIALGILTIVFIGFIVFFNISQSKSENLEITNKLIQEQNKKLQEQNQQLMLDFQRYLLFSDSIKNVIDRNNKLSNQKLKSLITLSNDELRAIANDR